MEFLCNIRENKGKWKDIAGFKIHGSAMNFANVYEYCSQIRVNVLLFLLIGQNA